MIISGQFDFEGEDFGAVDFHGSGALSAESALFLMASGAIEEIEAMAIGPEMLFFMSLFWWVPLVMAFLSVTLKDVVNRRVNLIIRRNLHCC